MGPVLVQSEGGFRRMKTVKLQIENDLYTFYQKVGENAGGLAPETVMADALFRLAGGLSLYTMREKERERLVESLTGGL